MNDQNTDPVTVLIADDHPVYLSGLGVLLNDIPSLKVVGEARTGEEAVAMTHQLRPDVVLMDVNLPGVSGIEATRRIAGRCPETSVIIVTMLEDHDTFFAAIRAGVRGYLMKGANSDDVGRAIDVVHAGGLVFDPQVADWVIDYLTKPPAAGLAFPELTERERAVLALVADGRGNATIARELNLSIKTVRNYLSRIFAKLQLGDRTEAAVRARRAGLGH